MTVPNAQILLAEHATDAHELAEAQQGRLLQLLAVVAVFVHDDGFHHAAEATDEVATMNSPR